MQQSHTKPLKNSVSFWGLIITLACIACVSYSTTGQNTGATSLTLLLLLALGFFPFFVTGIIAALTSAIVFTIYLTKRLGVFILTKHTINKPILYTALTIGVSIGVILAVYCAVFIGMFGRFAISTLS